jgi:HEPN domain-containing protein
MPPERGSPADWVRFAKSDLLIAREADLEGVLRESLCFHAQQAIEKCLKAALLASGVAFPKTHNLQILIDLLPVELVLPNDASEIAALTDYAVSARYPGDYEEISQDEYKHAVRLAEAIVRWAEGLWYPS